MMAWWACNAGPHQEYHILVPHLPVAHSFLEQLQVVLVVAIHLQQADGHLAVPAPRCTWPQRPCPDGLASSSTCSEGDVPLLQVHAGLAGLARMASPRAAEVGRLSTLSSSFSASDLPASGSSAEGIEGAAGLGAVTSSPQDPHQGREQRALGSGGLGSSQAALCSLSWTGHSAPHGLNVLIHNYGAWPFFPANKPKTLLLGAHRPLGKNTNTLSGYALFQRILIHFVYLPAPGLRLQHVGSSPLDRRSTLGSPELGVQSLSHWKTSKVLCFCLNTEFETLLCVPCCA